MGDIKKTIGKNINAQLALQNIKQKELAHFLGVKDNTVSYYCSGNRAPSLEQLVSIAEYFNVSIDTLMGRTSNKSENDRIIDTHDFIGLSESSVGFLRDLKRDSDRYVTSQNVLKVIDLLLSDEHANDNMDYWTRIQAFMFANGGDFTLNLTTGQFAIPRDEVLSALLNMNNLYLIRLKEELEAK